MSPANWVTLLRILLVPFFFTALVSYQPGEEHYRLAAFWIFLIAALTDAIDGALARLLNQKTELGRFLDPLADKLLLLSGFLGLLFVSALPYRPPLWITVTIVFRDLAVIIAMITLYFLSGKFRIETHFLGKWTTAAQMITLMAILLSLKVSPFLWNVTAILTIVSGFVYIFRDFKLLKGAS